MSSISEPPSEKRRGRPPAFDPDYFARMGNLFPDITTRCGLLNRCYALCAIGALKHAPEFAWVCPSKEAINAGTEGFAFAILSELGRVEDEAELKALAAEVCRDRPDAKKAVAMLRPGGRGGRRPRRPWT